MKDARLPAARRAVLPGVGRRELWSWAMYDFANSSFTTVVITAIFNAYFVAVIAGDEAWATFAWTAALAASNLALMLISPVLGAHVDRHGGKKRLLRYSTIGCVAATAALSLCGPGMLVPAIAFLVLANICFGAGENLIAAFLPELADKDNQGKVSGWGWSLGYVGGLLTLVVCLAFIHGAASFGLPTRQAVPMTMLITAGIFALASLPTFLFLKERARPRPQDTHGDGGVFRRSAAGLGAALRGVRQYPDLRRFLVCMVVYQAGIHAVIALAAIYAQQEMGFATQDTVLLIIVVNIAAAVGAFALGYVQDRIGPVATIGLTLMGWILMVALAWSAQGRPLFWAAAILAGLCLGASQSSARAFIGMLSPPGRSGEFFGLWGLAGRLSAIMGPMTYGLAVWLSRGDHRAAMLMTALYFVLGLVLLLGIDAERGRRASLA